MNNISTPLVSVVMPCYNGELYLREAIDSILNQTYKNLELIIINDGSKDSSEKIILSYTDSRVKYLINEQNSGICVTLNKGLDAAQGMYIARMDCDDISMPERFAKQVAYLESHPEVGIVGSDIITFGDGLEDRYFDFVHDKEGCKAGLLFNTCFAHPTVMFRRDIVDEHHLCYDDEYCGLEDFELWSRIAQYSELVNLPEPLLRYRHHKAQVTQNVTKKVSDKEVEFHKHLFAQYAQLSEEENNALVAYCFGKWNEMDIQVFNDLISALRKVVKSEQANTTAAFHKAMQITLSKVLAYTIAQANLNVSKPSVYTKALLNGIMPFDWYCKYMYHAIFKR